VRRRDTSRTGRRAAPDRLGALPCLAREYGDADALEPLTALRPRPLTNSFSIHISRLASPITAAVRLGREPASRKFSFLSLRLRFSRPAFRPSMLPLAPSFSPSTSLFRRTLFRALPSSLAGEGDDGWLSSTFCLLPFSKKKRVLSFKLDSTNRRVGTRALEELRWLALLLESPLDFVLSSCGRATSPATRGCGSSLAPFVFASTHASTDITDENSRRTPVMHSFTMCGLSHYLPEVNEKASRSARSTGTHKC
jgi:hypothetical protein